MQNLYVFRTDVLILLCFSMVFLGACAGPVADEKFDPQNAAITVSGRPVKWVYDTNGDEKFDFCEADSNGDGVVDMYQFDDDFDGLMDHKASAADSFTEAERTFILFVDGVPYSDLEALWEEGYFREFHRPGHMIGPFPSMTYQSFSQMFGTPGTPGYEDLYFDIAKNKLRGGISARLKMGKKKKGERDKTFYSKFGYKQPAVYAGLIYLFPIDTAMKDMRNVKRYFDSAKGNLAIGYLGTTDGIAHKLGRERTREMLKKIDLILREFVFEQKGRLRLIFASDHGDNYVASERIDLRKYLDDFGFKKGNEIEDGWSVVIPPYGLVGFAVAYLEEGSKKLFANAAVKIPGVDLAIFESAGVVYVYASRGRGRAKVLHKESEDKYKYDAYEGDPLELLDIARKLKEDGKMDEEGFAAEADWLEATKEHTYIDGLRRVYEGATDDVDNTANVILSLEDGSFYGSKFFDFITGIAGTHGSLRRSSTLGFVLCNYKAPPSYIRPREMKAFLDVPPDWSPGPDSD